MIEAGQSNLVTLLAGALLASCLVAVGALESAQAEDEALRAAIDALASQIARADCSPRHPESTIDLSATLTAIPDSVANLTLLPNHLRARTDRGVTFTSVEFPPLQVEGALELKGRAHLTLSFDFLSEACAATAA